MEEPRYVITVRDTARIVGVSERTVYNWLYQRKIEAYELPGGGWRIPLRAVAKLVGLAEQELRINLSASVKDAKGSSRNHVWREVPDRVVNLVRGGDFEDKRDIDEWVLDVEDGSEAEMKIDKTTAAIGKSSLFFEIGRLSGKDITRPRFSQVQAIEMGRIYTLSAFYKAKKERTVYIAVQLEGVSWIRFVEKIITIGTEWQEQWATFTATESGTVTIQPARNTGSDICYWVDGVRFSEGEYEPYNT